LLKKVFGFLLALLEWEKFLAFMIESVFEIQVFFGKRDAFLSQESDHLYPYLSHGGGPFMFLSISEKIDATLEGFYYEKKPFEIRRVGNRSHI